VNPHLEHDIEINFLFWILKIFCQNPPVARISPVSYLCPPHLAHSYPLVIIMSYRLVVRKVRKAILLKQLLFDRRGLLLFLISTYVFVIVGAMPTSIPTTKTSFQMVLRCKDHESILKVVISIRRGTGFILVERIIHLTV